MFLREDCLDIGQLPKQAISLPEVNSLMRYEDQLYIVIRYNDSGVVLRHWPYPVDQASRLKYRNHSTRNILIPLEDFLLDYKVYIEGCRI